ncbi:hypothetical protein JTS93_07925 [Clostridium botulinum]|nr:hypothetical protein [Clostridium botulinum]
MLKAKEREVERREYEKYIAEKSDLKSYDNKRKSTEFY